MKKTFILLTFAPMLSMAQSTLDKNVSSIKDSVITWRRAIHQHPELSNREFKTAAFVAEHLKKL
ncbi:MAG: N-acyl-L-amino acid amidohydrolase, partial [Bacteroidetes bacterium]|nr:N-acyl-L-amino acid amidohydrolase [Bacteroidota bacterium]